MGSQVEYDGMVYRLTSMNVMKQEAKLENREQVLFISLENLREKAIPRKGFIQQNNQKSDKPVHRTMVHEGVAIPVNKDKAVHVSTDLPTVKVESSKPQNNRSNNKKTKIIGTSIWIAQTIIGIFYFSTGVLGSHLIY